MWWQHLSCRHSTTSFLTLAEETVILPEFSRTGPPNRGRLFIRQYLTLLLDLHRGYQDSEAGNSKVELAGYTRSAVNEKANTD